MKGNYSSILDPKGRLVIPSKFRTELGNSVLVLSLSYDGTLELRTSKEFSTLEYELKQKDNLDKKIKNLKSLVMGNSFDLSLDSQGRILIPKELQKILNLKIGQSLQIIGQGEIIQIMSSRKWEELIKNFLSKNE